MYSQEQLADHAERVRVLESTSAALNHLDTRESELKADAYRSISDADPGAVAGSLRSDETSVDDAVAALEALELPAEIRGGIDSAKPDMPRSRAAPRSCGRWSGSSGSERLLFAILTGCGCYGDGKQSRSAGRWRSAITDQLGAPWVVHTPPSLSTARS